MGLPVGIVDWPEELDDPAWTTAAGLAMYSARLKAQSELEKHDAGTAGMLSRDVSRQRAAAEVDMALIDGDIDALKYEIEEETRAGARIKVIGVGGGGSNAVARMMGAGAGGRGVLRPEHRRAGAGRLSRCPTSCRSAPRSPAAWAPARTPSVGRQAALEDTDRIVELLQGADMVFVTAGLGGGTGTGAAPVVASLAKELDALTVAVVTKPFGFEGPRRMKLAERRAWRELAATVDTVIAIPNDRLLALVPRGTSFFEAFKIADDLLRQAVQGISDIITTPGPDQPRLLRHQGHHAGHGLRHDGHGHGARRERRGRGGPAGHQLPAARRGRASPARAAS